MFTKMYTVFTTNGEGKWRGNGRAESWNRTEEAPTSTSTASASLWEREARDGRKWGDVETGRVGTAGRKNG